jgi:hypothetical protein
LRVIPDFAWGNLRNGLRRIALGYFVRDFNVGTLQLLTAVPLIAWSLGFGGAAWARSIALQRPSTAGTVMLAALPLIVGMQLLLGFITYDLLNVPRTPLHPILSQLATQGSPNGKHAAA